MKAFTIKKHAHIFVYAKPVSMCNGFPGLSNLIETKLQKKPTSGDLFLFLNKKKNYLKILFYSENGECMYSKHLPSGTFSESPAGQITIRELNNLVDRVILHGSRKLNPFKIAA
jgi:transposase